MWDSRVVARWSEAIRRDCSVRRSEAVDEAEFDRWVDAEGGRGCVLFEVFLVLLLLFMSLCVLVEVSA